MATHSSVLAWRIPGMEEPGGLPPMGLHRVGHDWWAAAYRVAQSRTRLKRLSSSSSMHTQGFPGGTVIKNLPANAGDMGFIPSWEDHLEKDTATHSSILAWKIAKESDTT